ncbi:hypothetical protein CAG70_20615 [Photobacterium halotolerans]|uniref:hypothetical protein n=1 Tax=Photobacterium halotolerans TaxID=265726 RepID=UPI00137358A1|nr:hypothetical protein [Photobacterium halotolerans]NAX49390.1 hypothetical protein [Photobacterium halotolerans]
MKYKLINSMIHNFTHSFVGDCNYVDDAFVIEDLYKIARLKKGEVVIITWHPVKTEELFKLTPRVRKAIGYYRDWFPKHAENHRVPLEHLTEYRTEVFMANNHQLCVKAVAIDDRGKEYSCYVRP